MYLLVRLDAAGYATTDRLVNALEYGAAQDRDRVILIGFKRSVFGSDQHQFPWEQFVKHDKKTIKGFSWPIANDFVENSKTAMPSGLPVESTCQYWFDKNEVDTHPNAKHHLSRKHYIDFKLFERGAQKANRLSGSIAGDTLQLAPMATTKSTYTRIRPDEFLQLRDWRCNLYRKTFAFLKACLYRRCLRLSEMGCPIWLHMAWLEVFQVILMA